jgi:hypothetical protein
MQFCKTRGNYRFKRAVAMLATGVAVAIGIGVTDGIGVADVSAAEPAREAHDTYCIACHSTSVYTRSERLAGDYGELREHVDRWQGTISLSWSAEEIDQMASWLAKHYYQFPCPDQC